MAPHSAVVVRPLEPLKPDLRERAWQTIPHPTLPLVATAHAKSVTIFSLVTLSSHSTLTGGHARSVRCSAWKPGLSPHKLCLVTGSFDSTAGLWRWDGDQDPLGELQDSGAVEVEVTADGIVDNIESHNDKDWEFTLVLEGHDSEIKSCAFSPSGAFLATCSRDKSVWIWEDIGASEEDDEWETVAVLNEHEGDVKAVAWCPDVPGRNTRRTYSPEVLASASYDNTVRIWREDGDGEWVCVAVLEGHTETVWGIQWEANPKDGKFPRLLSYSADATVRIWKLQEEDQDETEDGGVARSTLGGIPNTMRRSLREEWTCESVLPKSHDRDVYSASWSADTGYIASTGSDGRIIVYAETISTGNELVETPVWTVVADVPNAHGPYEVNHIIWSKRYDNGASAKGEEEILLTTGDDGLVRPWTVSAE